ncbi:fungal-specific transcription factor domain-containing protein [Biscogniauxia sp. FL1348]|nr:fungal-specific transcription factor domain-containing protein [Biscogniauxia sp. FL1348]
MAHSPLSPPCQEPGEAGLAHATNAPIASSTSRAQTSTSAPYPHIRSCTLCRQRKVKCDRQHPCSGCSRAGSSCVYPPGPGRAAKKPRKTLDTQLMGRLSKLENIIKRLQTQTDGQVPEPGHERPDAAAYAEASVAPADGSSRAIQGPSIPQPKEPGPSLTPETLVTQNLGRLVVDETKSYYIGNILWAELGNEIEELRDMLHESSSEESEDQLAAATPPPPASSLYDEGSSPCSAPLGSDAAILGYRSLAHSLRSFHPPYEQCAELFTAFNERVLPIVYVFHMPTTARLFWDSVSALRSRSSSESSPVDRDTEALLFAIYYAAAASLEAPSSTLARYRFATEQALARASLLTTQSVTVLQAAVLFLTALRYEDDSRTVWSLTALVFHIAQAMGLHRDGAAFGLRPLETEVRRRLWYNICVLDTRSSDYHGYEPIVHEHGFDTRMPLNVCDADLTPDMREPPPERDGEFTPMTFGRIRGEIMRAGWKLSYVSPRSSSSSGVRGAQAESQSIEERIAVVEDLRTTLTEKYLRYCDPTVPFQALASMVARVVMARMWLVVYFPLGRRTEYANASIRTDYNPDTSMRDKIFSTAVEILELTSIVHSHRDFSKWSWHSRTYMQWQSVALVLYEICLRPPSPECDRAWEYINIINNADLAINRKDRKGSLWRPIERLMTKARHVREMQRANPSGYQHNTSWSSAAIPLYLPERGPVASGAHQTPGIVPNSLQEPRAEGDSIQGMLDTNFFDPFLESLPDAVQDDLFGTILSYNPEL